MDKNNTTTLVPTSGMSFEHQVKILRTYLVLSKMGEVPVHFKKVMRMTESARSQISGVNSFFEGLGFLERVETGTYKPTSEILGFYSNTPGEENFKELSSSLEKSELFQFVKDAVMIHGDPSLETLLSLLLKESRTQTKSRARRAIQWLASSGLITIDDENIVHITE